MPFTLYRVTADKKKQDGIVIGPGFITEDYSEAVAQAVEWRENPSLTNIGLTARHYG
jgi:hypothetical protein